MEGGDENMEVNITMQQDDESIWIESNQFMEKWSEFDFQQVLHQEPLLVQETSTPTKQVSNPLLTSAKPVQLVHLNLVESAQVKPIYIFPKTSITYVQQESLK